ncbi:unnamed protein product [Arctia plantaginis]|uniref:Major facilitator superfamily (MFS) profile domain-containing protein n=1 Tax=Arctia plantaginis TaxID=874455 RepID=A0A8S1B5T2_ARCPL|nr:unnamed protein product [Arctia plantaginis]
MDSDKISIEAAITRAGFGLYGCLMTALTALILIAFACIAYGVMFIVPTSACELQTTTAQQGLLASAPIISLLLGGVVWSYLADTRGRRAMLLICLAGGTLFNLIGTISVNWIMLMVFQLIAGIFAAGIYSVSMTLLSESVPMTHRNSAILIVASVMFLGQGIKGLIALPIISLTFSYYLPSLGIYWNSWRTLMLVYSIPAIVSGLALFFMQESPKFVFNKRGETESLEILKRIHRVNNWRSKEELLIKGIIQDELILPKTQSSVRDQLFPLFKAPLLKSTIIMLFMNLTQQ